MRKTFPCGHKGKGSYCHRCEKERIKTNKDRAIKAAWLTTFDSDPIDLRPLRKRSRIEKARHIIASIEAGITHSVFKGKRLIYDRNVISVPVNIDYRLIYRQQKDGRIVLDKLMSHEEYNGTKPG